MDVARGLVLLTSGDSVGYVKDESFYLVIRFGNEKITRSK